LCVYFEMSKTRVGILAVAAIASAAVLSACDASVSAGSGEVSQSTVQSEVARQLAAETQQPTPTVSCPGGLKATVGATVDCTLTPKGKTTRFPVHVTVISIAGGTAHFSAQVGQAAGAGDKVAFCTDNAKLNQATSGVHQASDLVPIFKANRSLLDEFQAKAPSAIVDQAGTLVLVANHAITSGDASALTTPPVLAAGRTVDAYCGQNADGSPTTAG
jgi:hypothetical protein